MEKNKKSLKAINNSQINTDFVIEKNLNVNDLNILNDTSIYGDLSCLNLSVNGDWTLKNNLDVSGKLTLNGQATASKNIDASGKRVMNVGNPTEANDLVNFGTIDNMRPAYYHKNASLGNYWWNKGNVNWDILSAKAPSVSSNLYRYLEIEGTKMHLLRPGIYDISVSTAKVSKAGNGYGDILQICVVENGNEVPLCCMDIWSSFGGGICCFGRAVYPLTYTPSKGSIYFVWKNTGWAYAVSYAHVDVVVHPMPKKFS